MATNMITTTTATIIIYNNTDKTINSNTEQLDNNLSNVICLQKFVITVV